MGNPARGDKVPSRLAVLLGAGGQPNTKAEWASVDSTSLGDLVRICGANSVGVLFGASRDGGALSLTFFWDGQNKSSNRPERKTVWCGVGEDAQSWVDRWIVAFDEALSEGT